MIDQTALAAYILIVLGILIVPGPAMLLTLARATASCPRVGLATAAGIAVGDVLHTAMAIVGISALIAASATLFTAVKYAGAAYLCYLGLKAIFERSSLDLEGAAPRVTPRRAFREAVLAETLNPKTALFFLAFLPQFVRPELGNVALQLAILGGIFVVLGFLETASVALGAGRVGLWLRRRPGVVRHQGKVVGAVYLGLGARLALQER